MGIHHHFPCKYGTRKIINPNDEQTTSRHIHSRGLRGVWRGRGKAWIIKTLMPHPCSLALCYNAAMSRSRVRARAPRNLDAQSWFDGGPVGVENGDMRLSIANKKKYVIPSRNWWPDGPCADTRAKAMLAHFFQIKVIITSLENEVSKLEPHRIGKRLPKKRQHGLAWRSQNKLWACNGGFGGPNPKHECKERRCAQGLIFPAFCLASKFDLNWCFLWRVQCWLPFRELSFTVIFPSAPRASTQSRADSAALTLPNFFPQAQTQFKKFATIWAFPKGALCCRFLFPLLLTTLLHDVSDNAQPCCDEVWTSSYLQMRHSLSPQARQGQDRYATNRIMYVQLWITIELG